MSTLKENIYLPIIALMALLAAICGNFFLRTDEYWRGIAIELGGVFWEVCLITVILGFYEAKRRKKDKIHELNRRINDFKRLDDDYSKAVIGSSLRELKELGVTAPYDFRGMQLSNFSFDGDFEVSDISGSIFSDGLYLSEARKNSTSLKDVIFNGVDCKNVVFNKGGLGLATYENCFFCASNLAGASFCGAHLKWSKDQVIENEQDWYSYEGDGSPAFLQQYFPPFHSANLEGVIFDKCYFERADFRGAENILDASFKDVRGIESCFFDKGVLEQLKKTGRLAENKD